MLERIKEYIVEAGEKIEELSERIESKAEDFADDGSELWRDFKPQLSQLNSRLHEAAQRLQSGGEEAHLQAHLAAMDAADQWQALAGQLSAFAHHAGDQSRPLVDRAALQAHLAKMDARDFIAEQGEDISAKFQHSRDQLEQSSLKAAANIKESCEGLIAGLPK